jgi:preprotein translocase subunit YajC
MHQLLFLCIARVQEASETAPPSGPPGGSPFSSLLIPMALILVVFYVVMIGPERKQRKKREAMLAALGKGDKVMTSGGMYGTVAAVQDDVVTLQVADGVRVRFARSSIQSVLTDEKPADKPAGDKPADKADKADVADMERKKAQAKA